MIHGQHFISPNNHRLSEIAKSVDDAGWVIIKDDIHFTIDDLFSDNKLLGISKNDTFKLVRTKLIGEGIYLSRYQQTYRGIRIEGAQLNIQHTLDGRIKLYHGEVFESNGKFNVNPQIAKSNALTRALSSTNSSKFVWNMPSIAGDYGLKPNKSGEYFPVTELIIANPTEAKVNKDNMNLYYMFQVIGFEPHINKSIYVNAQSGKVEKEVSNIKNCSSNIMRTGTTNYYGDLQCQTRNRWPVYNDFILESCQANFKLKQDPEDDCFTTWGETENIIAASGDEFDDNPSAYTGYYAAINTWYYFKNTFGLEGVDGSNRELRIWNDSPFANGPCFANGPAFDPIFDGNHSFILLGEPTGFPDLATLDVVSHEWTHGISAFHANFNGTGEPAALNESFSDILSKAFESDMAQSSASIDFSYILAHDAGFVPGFSPSGGTGIRNMADPHTHSDPDTYQGTFWNNKPPHGDGMPHGHWFYLLAEGGNQNGVNVLGIGIEDAAKIVFRNLTVYMQTNSDYADARIGAIQAAEDIFGECSFEVWQVMEAWEAIGVGTSAGICVEISGDSPVCSNAPTQLSATGVDGANYNWNYIPSSWNYYTSGSDGEYLNILDFGTSLTGTCYNIGVTSTISGESDSDLFSICLEDCGGGVNREASPEISMPIIYPNPTKGELNITNTYDSITIQIYNAKGQLLNSIFSDTKSNLIELDEKPGVYFVRGIDYNTGVSIFVEKIIKL